ncbi:MAG: flagellar hook-basal body complex protein, partial [Zoogloea sp.]|nr:flagellar hook-basal body complex protein [Zoogloea sp.]
AAEGLPYTGFLYAGLMIDAQGQPRTVEFNCRLGDPETQPILMRLKSDLFDVLMHATDGTLDRVELEWDRRVALGVVMAASGYPLQPAITIPANALSVTIGKDGVVSVTLPGQTAPSQIGNIQIAGFVNPGGLQSVGENLYLETAASGTANPNTPGTNGVGVLNQTYVETSNVNVAEELVLMIQTQRAYELNSRAVSTSDSMLGKLTSL